MIRKTVLGFTAALLAAGLTMPAYADRDGGRGEQHESNENEREHSRDRDHERYERKDHGEKEYGNTRNRFDRKYVKRNTRHNDND